MALPVFLLTRGSTIPNTFAHGAFHQLALLATSPTFHNLVKLFFVRQYVGKLWTHRNVFVNLVFVLFAQIKALTF